MAASSVVHRLEQAVVCVPLALLGLHTAQHLLTATPARPALHSHDRLHEALEDASASYLRLLHCAFLVAYEWLVKADGVGRAAGVAWMIGLAMWIMVLGDPKEDRHQRKGATGGLLLGCLTMPMVFAAQLCLHQQLRIAPVVTSLFWLSLCCSTSAVIAASAGDSVSDVAGPGLTEVFTACLLGQTAFAVQDMLMSGDTLVVLGVFAYTLHFLLHTLRFSFTPGEAVCMSTMLSLLISNGVFSLLGHAIQWYPRASRGRQWLGEWIERAMILDVSATHPSRRAPTLPRTSSAHTLDPLHAQSTAFYNALLSLHLGVLLLGVLWFGPFALRWKRARTQQARLERKERLVEVQVREREEQPGLEVQPAALARGEDKRKQAPNGQLSLEKEGDGVEGKPPVKGKGKLLQAIQPSSSGSSSVSSRSSASLAKLKRRRAPAVPADESQHEEETDSLLPHHQRERQQQQREGEDDEYSDQKEGAGAAASSSSKWNKKKLKAHRDPLAPPVAPSLLSSYSPLSIWLLLLVLIFTVVYPYIGLEMSTEPFTFVWEYVVTCVPTDEAFWQARRQRTANEDDGALPPSLLFSALHSAHRLSLFGWDASFLARNIRLTVAAVWIGIIAIGVAVCAPMGRATKLARAGEGRDEVESPEAMQLGAIPNSHLHQQEGVVRNDQQVSVASVQVASPRRPGASLAPSPAAVVVAGPSSSRSLVSRIPNILIRKYYHFLAAALFLPAILVEPGFVALAMAVAMSLFILVEYIRVSRLPPIGRPIHEWMKTYLDQRDAGMVILTHAYLLLGCAIPLWLHLHVLAAAKADGREGASTSGVVSPVWSSSFDSNLRFMRALSEAISHSATGAGDAAYDRYGSPDRPDQQLLVWDMSIYLPALAGVLVLGVGDSMASLVGVWLGRHRWFGTSRTVEGTLAAIASILACAFGLVQLMHGVNGAFFAGVLTIVEPRWWSFLLSTVLTCLLEAFTTQIDNLFLPIFFYTCMIVIGT